ncbi:MAG: hypothetical protein RLZZ38_1240 [Bacteroidota bacterium]|jgi:hypothetical protein
MKIFLKTFGYTLVTLVLISCSSIYYQRPQPIYGIETNEIPIAFQGSFYKKNNQITTDENNVIDSFFYFNPQLTIGPNSIKWYQESASDTTDAIIYHFDNDTSRSILLLTQDYIVFNLHNDLGKIQAYEPIFTRRNPKDSVIKLYSGLPGGNRKQKLAWQKNIQINQYDMLTNDVLRPKDFKRIERRSTPVLALTKNRLQNTLLDEGDILGAAEEKKGIQLPKLFKSKDERRVAKMDALTDRYAKKILEEPTYIIFYQMFNGEEYVGSGIAVLEKKFKHQDYHNFFAQFIEKSYTELNGVYNFQTEECALLPYKNCQQLNLSKGQVSNLDDEDIKRLKNNLKFQNGNMLLPDFWQDPIKFTKLSPKQGKQKLKILINELD